MGYHEICRQLIPRMNALLKRAQDGEANLVPEYQILQTEFDAHVANGFVDWENDIAIHLRALKWWCENAVVWSARRQGEDR